MPRATSTVEAATQDQDRVAVVHVYGALVLVLADGAGGRSGGTEAADGVIRLAKAQAHDLVGGRLEPTALLGQIDHALAEDANAGEATAVVAVVSGGEVRGASVGDSGAWLIGDESLTDLTRRQVRKPMVGSGRAVPVAFGPAELGEQRLLLASDGLLKYAAPEAIRKAAWLESIKAASSALVEAVRMPSGNLPDDVSVILCTA